MANTCCQINGLAEGGGSREPLLGLGVSENGQLGDNEG